MDGEQERQLAAANRLLMELRQYLLSSGQEFGVMLTSLAWLQGTMIAQGLAHEPAQATLALRRTNSLALAAMEMQLAHQAGPHGPGLLAAIPAGQA